MNIGLTAGRVKETPFSLHNTGNVLGFIGNLNRSINFIFRRTVTVNREAVGGVSLVAGLALATGADTLPQALLTLAAFVVAGACLHEKEEKGGAA